METILERNKTISENEVALTEKDNQIDALKDLILSLKERI